jgi:hypothetical protein
MSGGRGQQPSTGSNYPAVGVVIVGLALGIAAAAATREPVLMLVGLGLGAVVAVWLSRRGLDGDR